MSESHEPTPETQAGANAGKMLICPYCGDAQPVVFTEAGVQSERCRSCAGLFEPLSRQATHNTMGPWFVRDVRRPHQPGCSYETLARLVKRGKVTKLSIVRGPTTRQFWTIAKRVPGIAHLLGYCHSCDASVDAGDHGCHACGVSFGAFLDRNFLGLPEVRPLPWEQDERPGDSREFIDMANHDPNARTWHHGLPAIRDRGINQPQGLSSFATDEELKAVDAPAISWQAPVQTAASEQAVVSRKSAVELRMRRRRSAQQERVIQRLMATSILLAVFAIAALIGWMSATLTSPAQSTQQHTQQSGTLDEHDVQDADVSGTGNGIDHDEADIAELPPVLFEDILEEPIIGENAHELVFDEGDVEHARELLHAARDEQRELDDRIDDSRQAVKILQSVKQSMGEDDWPTDLEELLAEAVRMLDHLELRKYFP